MNEKIKYLNRIRRIIDADDFYNILITDEISFMGKYSPDKVKKYCKLNFKFTTDANGFLEAKRGAIRILLTN